MYGEGGCVQNTSECWSPQQQLLKSTLFTGAPIGKCFSFSTNPYSVFEPNFRFCFSLSISLPHTHSINFSLCSWFFLLFFVFFFRSDVLPFSWCDLMLWFLVLLNFVCFHCFWSTCKLFNCIHRRSRRE